MIRLDNVSKQVGHQILFIEASAALQKGEKIGLVGPNGAGKTTLFRMIAGQETPDEGQVSLDRGITIGYFSQDVGEMAGRSAVAEVMDGAGPVSVVAAELRELEAAKVEGVEIFHAGTVTKNGKILANGGRVLNICAMGKTVAEAQRRAYAAVDRIHWPEGFCRRDIGWQAVKREKG